MKQIVNPIFHKLSLDILSVLDDRINYSMKIAKVINATPSAVIVKVQYLEKERLINKYCKGRKAILTLTDKGKKVKEKLRELMSLIN